MDTVMVKMKPSWPEPRVGLTVRRGMAGLSRRAISVAKAIMAERPAGDSAPAGREMALWGATRDIVSEVGAGPTEQGTQSLCAFMAPREDRPRLADY